MTFFVSSKLRGFAAFFCQSADVFCQVYCGGGVRDETFQNSKPNLRAVQSIDTCRVGACRPRVFRLRPLQNPHLWHISAQCASLTLENISIFSARSAMLLL